MNTPLSCEEYNLKLIAKNFTEYLPTLSNLQLNLVEKLLDYLTIEQIDILDNIFEGTQGFDSEKVWLEHLKIITNNQYEDEFFDNCSYKTKYFNCLFDEMHYSGNNLFYEFNEGKKLHVLDVNIQMLKKKDANSVLYNSYKVWKSEWTKHVSRLRLVPRVWEHINTDENSNLKDHFTINTKYLILHQSACESMNEFAFELLPNLVGLCLIGDKAALMLKADDYDALKNLRCLCAFEIINSRSLGILEHLKNLESLNLKSIKKCDKQFEEILVNLIIKYNLKNLSLDSVNLRNGSSGFIVFLLSRNNNDVIKLEYLKLAMCDTVNIDRLNSFEDFNNLSNTSIKTLVWLDYFFEEEKVKLVYELLRNSNEIIKVFLRVESTYSREFKHNQVSIKKIMECCPNLNNLSLHGFVFNEKDTINSVYNSVIQNIKRLDLNECNIFNPNLEFNLDNSVIFFKFIIENAKALRYLYLNVDFTYDQLMQFVMAFNSLVETKVNLNEIEISLIFDKLNEAELEFLLDDFCEKIKISNGINMCNIQKLTVKAPYVFDNIDHFKRNYQFFNFGLIKENFFDTLRAID